FDIDITYIKGKLNKVADCLSQYYESDTLMDTHQPHKYVQADVCIDPAGDNLPGQWYREVTSKIIELQAIHSMEHCHSKQLQEQQETHDLEAKLMDEANQHIIDNMSNMAEAPSISEKIPENPTPSSYEFIKQIQSGYKDDKLFAHILEKPGEYTDFEVKDDLIWQKNQQSIEVVCIPCNRGMIMQVLDQAHTILGHFGDQWTNEYTQ
ncbi:hypothetical protein L208DRAFT_1271020, partial [Tricholoma matsutake]